MNRTFAIWVCRENFRAVSVYAPGVVISQHVQNVRISILACVSIHQGKQSVRPRLRWHEHQSCAGLRIRRLNAIICGPSKLGQLSHDVTIDGEPFNCAWYITSHPNHVIAIGRRWREAFFKDWMRVSIVRPVDGVWAWLIKAGNQQCNDPNQYAKVIHCDDCSKWLF